MANLAAKYRPQKMTDMTEQRVVVNIVKNICEADEISNRNFLFIGPAGVGKTTLAKAIGYALNGNNENVIELDAASHSGVNDMREIIEQSRAYPECMASGAENVRRATCTIYIHTLHNESGEDTCNYHLSCTDIPAFKDKP